MFRLGLVFDFVEENWPSMDLVAEMLLRHLRSLDRQDFRVDRICPRMVPRFGRLPLIRKKRAAWNGDRLVNRFWDYPRHLRTRFGEFDCFHICDHSYAHLVHELPANRTGVFCHDLDCFRCLMDPRSEPRPRWFRAMSRRILSGLQKAAIVFCSTRVAERQIRQLGLVDAERLVYVPYGVLPEFAPSPSSFLPRGGGKRSKWPPSRNSSGATNRVASGVSERRGISSFLLHVGSCIARKRIDVLLKVFAKLKSRMPELQLVQIGGVWTLDHLDQIKRLNISSAVHQQCGIDRRCLADLYRQALMVMQPSEAEGFGLPVLEALACGAVVVASDIPVLREVGGDGAVYCPVDDVSHWVDTIGKLLLDPSAAPDRTRRLAQAQRFSWDRHAQLILQAYQDRCFRFALGA